MRAPRSAAAEGFRLVEFPRTRLATVDVGRYGRTMHTMSSLLEVDVTDARRAVRRARRATGGASFTAWMIKTIGDCVAEHPLVHALKGGRRTLVLFNDVDIALPVERAVEGARVPLAFRVRAVNRKTASEVDAEIEAARRQDISTEKDYALGEHGFSAAAMRFYYALPQWMRLAAFRWLLGNPVRARRTAGTVIVTTVNATGSAAGWLLPTRSLHNLSVALGAVTRKPWVVGDAVVPRDILHLTVTFNHDVIDGVPAREFISDLVGRIQHPPDSPAGADPRGALI